MSFPPIVSASWLTEHIHDKNILPLDGTWYMPGSDHDPEIDFRKNHVPGAVFFDVDDISDQTSNLPHMLPTEADFAQKVSALGISNDHTIVAYSQGDLPTAARVWWMFRIMGHEKVCVLDGGLSAWIAAGNSISSAPLPRDATTYKAMFQPELVRSATEVAATLKDTRHQVLDARPNGRFTGAVPEPRAGLRSGHIPGSISLPVTELYNSDSTLKNTKALQDIVAAKAIDLTAPITTSCGSGMMACNIALALACLGKWDTAVYDGSWTEWGALSSLPVKTGE
ncbi:3-mercaptopyruvate sulfurtransferase [Kordiimonas pumila]|uniref:3-mercaptopyruvate sulfurtransferase n=1 Tax=Kordiimonas pumila TaxID=2161677 RepID=A0ABV7D398_9PROT|nr:3-mercaptopyruvate sulfurtransferase [Kordiimonas pumila]